MPMPVALSPRDDAERFRATTTFDRNVVVTAGAGTGKTTLLVDRLVHLLMREPDPLRITDIVALTFTNKAANEMKTRLRLRLESYAGCGRARSTGNSDEAHREVEALRTLYRLSSGDIDRRARDALRYLERSEIGTIHSFAASLLRLYPLEAGIDPRFTEDEGNLFAEHFESLWALWLDEELSGRSPRTEMWKHALGRFSLDEIREVARGLCTETIDLDRVEQSVSHDHTSDVLKQWLRELEHAAAELVEQNPGDRRIERNLRITRTVLAGAARGDAAERVTDEEQRWLERTRPVLPRGWDMQAFARARELIRIAVTLLRVDRRASSELISLTAPFARRFREAFGHEGLVSFDGLLVRARNLLRDRPTVRHELKTRFKAVLVDEFQDTDPLQYEILLFLCEQAGQCAKNWQEIRLAPGKVFVVGDPKQSIYSFRGADIAAYLEVVHEIIRAQDGIECRLTTNFRSQSGILEVVNGAFGSLFQSRRGLQPEYIGIDSGADAAAAQFGPAVTLRKVRAPGEAPNADTARQLEAESLADWLAHEVIGRMRVRSSEGEEVVAQPGHVAYLMRSLTQVQTYLEPLRRRGIGYVVEGERNFYATQEVIDAVNLLRAIDNPHDRLALAGVLRSPLGGQNDLELFELSRQNLLDYRLIASPRWVDLPGSVAGVYQRLFRLHRELRRLTVGAAVARIFREFPLAVLAARTFSGERAVANLEKIRDIAEEMGGRGAATLKEVVGELERRVRHMTEEPESALDEETLESVKVMSIHKSKGLEFPIVVLVDAMGARERGHQAPAEVKQDWCTGLVGLRVGRVWNLPGVFLDARRRLGEEQERIRLLYVAMTRPTTRLVISCGDRPQRGGGSLLALLDNAAAGLLAAGGQDVVRCGSGEIVLESPVASLEDGPLRARPENRGAHTSDLSSYGQRWQTRWDRHAKLRAFPLFLTPTGLSAEHAETTDETAHGRGGTLTRDQALLLGEVTHRILEHWNFQTTHVGGDLDAALAAQLDRVADDKVLIEREVRTIWRSFAGSAAYRELEHARILGRELPFLIPWGDQIMEGVIDVLYELSGEVYVADYKTDRLDGDELAQVRQEYRHQADIYTKAVERSLGRKVAGFKLILLRLGLAVSA